MISSSSVHYDCLFLAVLALGGCQSKNPPAADIGHKCIDGWCRIPAGTFVMGSPEDELGRGTSEDQVQVTFTQALWVKQYEVTQAEWTAEGLPNPSGLMKDGTGDCSEPTCPVGNVTWFETVAFANLLSRKEGLQECYQLDQCSPALGEGMACQQIVLTTSTLYQCSGYRLPTEAEWEYAVRATTTTAFYSGDFNYHPEECPRPVLDPIAWYCNTAGGFTHPIGLKQPNLWQLYDMTGNAAEWVHDNYGGYGELPLTDPDGDMVQDSDRVFRGVGFNGWAELMRSAAHLSGSWDSRGPGLGFRLVRSVRP